jgi:hypothetical protein
VSDEAATEPQPSPEEWAQVEVFGHRRHFGRICEVERFGTKMLRVDVPTDSPEVFETFFYGGASIFSVSPMTEETARKWAERARPRPYQASAALPAPEPFDVFDEPDEAAERE